MKAGQTVYHVDKHKTGVVVSDSEADERLITVCNVPGFDSSTEHRWGRNLVSFGLSNCFLLEGTKVYNNKEKATGVVRLSAQEEHGYVAVHLIEGEDFPESKKHEIRTWLKIDLSPVEEKSIFKDEIKNIGLEGEKLLPGDIFYNTEKKSFGEVLIVSNENTKFVSVMSPINYHYCCGWFKKDLIKSDMDSYNRSVEEERSLQLLEKNKIEKSFKSFKYAYESSAYFKFKDKPNMYLSDLDRIGVIEFFKLLADSDIEFKYKGKTWGKKK